MGHSSYSDDLYAARQVNQASSGKSAFNYSDQVVKSIPVSQRGVNDAMNIKGKIRESRDSAAHPNSKAIAVLFDVTGSMGMIPRELQKKLPTLMSLILRKGYVADPQIMFGAIGDTHSDQAPIQIGQFESGVEMDQAFEHMWLEGNGGGQKHESYELAMYYMARKTSIDCFEKRGELGYLFIIGDELPWETLSKSDIAAHLGDNMETDVSLAEIISQVTAKYETFFIHIPSGAYHDDDGIAKVWQGLLPERVIEMPDISLVCETIASTIGLMEGTTDDIAKDLKDVGAGHAVSAVKKALATLTPKGGSDLAKTDSVRGVTSLS